MRKSVGPILCSIVILCITHALPRWRAVRRHHISTTPTYAQENTLPSRLTNDQKAYLLSQSPETRGEAITLRSHTKTKNARLLYNLGTSRAQQTFSSGVISDLNELRRAEQELSGAVDMSFPKTPQAYLHNLTTVRTLLSNTEQATGTGSSSPSPTEQTIGDRVDDGKENNTSSQPVQGNKGEGNENELLTPEFKKQLTTYQQKLLDEQKQNQQFFLLPQDATSSGNQKDR